MPSLSWEGFQEYLFALCYTQHGGSGLGLDVRSFYALDWNQVTFLVERLEDQRRAEAAAIRSGKK